MSKVDLSVKMAGLTLSNPVMTASGTFGYGVEFMDYGDLADLGGIVLKGMSLKPREGNPMPRVAETACGMLNAVGLQNMGVEAFLRDKLPALPWRDLAVVANLYAQSADEFAELASVLAQREEIAALELNISCPNVKKGGAAFGQDPVQAGTLTRAVKQASGNTPVIVKLSPNVTDITAIAKSVEENGADMISCINTLMGMAVDLERRKPVLANVIGGLSGPAIKPVALRCVHQVVGAVDIPVIAVGGIATARDVLEFVLVGAHAVQIGTANFLRPDTAFRLPGQIETLMRELGVQSLDELRGALSV